MTFIEMLHRRRSCRRFAARGVEKEKIETLLRAALAAPSSKNCHSTRFAAIENREMLERISTMRTTGAAFVKDAPLAVAVMADASLTDLWQENCAISAITLQYAAESEGLGSCWVHVNGRPHREDDPLGGSAEAYLHTFLPIPEGYRVLCFVVMGYPAEEARPRAERDDSDKIFYF